VPLSVLVCPGRCPLRVIWGLVEKPPGCLMFVGLCVGFGHKG
jgi:hypothetical protein